jgi:hypothetical protein
MAIDPSVSDTFPRPIEDILAAALPALEVHRVRSLDVKGIVAQLGDSYGIDERSLLEGGNESLGGFTYADMHRALVFVEVKYGTDFENFTLAHEAGHIAKELLPRLAQRHQSDMFAVPTGRLIAHRDPPEVIFDAVGFYAAQPIEVRLRSMKAKAEAWTREVIANACAAELLAPWTAVQRVVAAAPPSSNLVELVSTTFGLSGRAARIRLVELGLLPTGAPRLL